VCDDSCALENVLIVFSVDGLTCTLTVDRVEPHMSLDSNTSIMVVIVMLV
jgi:hypothetical protein